MTTHTYSSVIDHTSTAGFRAWGSEFSAALSSSGLVKVTSLNEIDWLTANYSATPNTIAGFEMWRLADSSLYFKIQYGTGLNSLSPTIRIQVGTVGDAFGNILEGASRESLAANIDPSSTSTSFTSYICTTADSFGFVWKADATNTNTYHYFQYDEVVGRDPSALGIFSAGKLTDNSGAFVSPGYFTMCCNNPSTSPLATATGNGFGDPVPTLQGGYVGLTGYFFTYPSNSFCLFPGIPYAPILPASSTDRQGNVQVATIWTSYPDVSPYIWAVSYCKADIPDIGTTFTADVTGLTPHTYMACGVSFLGWGFGNDSHPGIALAMIWE